MGQSQHDLIPPKITAPRPTRLYPRQRLFELFDSRREAHGLIWVSAPAGAGKTSLAASYLASRKLPTLWYQVDAGDGDIALFFFYLGLAVARIAPQHQQPMLALTPEYLGDLPTFARNYFRELYRRLPPDCVIVLDNYQDAPPQSSLHAMLPIALHELPQGMGFVVLSREEPPVTLARLRLSGEITCIDMQLTVEESQGVSTVRLGEVAPDHAMLCQLHEHTQGWVAGLVLLLEQSRIGNAFNPSQIPAGRELLFDYFAGEVFAQFTAVEYVRAIGNTTIDVAFSHLDNSTNVYGTTAFGSSFSCNRPHRSARRGGDWSTFAVSIPTPTVFYTIGGTVSGLTGTGLVLQNNGGDNTPVSTAGGFTFGTTVGAVSPYAVTVLAQPTGQTCTVANGSGTANANVAVSCVVTPNPLVSGVLSARAGHTCALKPDGTVACWGLNTSYQLGDGGGLAINKNSPVAVSGLSGVVAVAASTFHSCAIKADASVVCWGANGAGQIGDGSGLTQPTPVAVSGLSGVKALSGARSHLRAQNRR